MNRVQTLNFRVKKYLNFSYLFSLIHVTQYFFSCCPIRFKTRFLSIVKPMILLKFVLWTFFVRTLFFLLPPTKCKSNSLHRIYLIVFRGVFYLLWSYCSVGALENRYIFSLKNKQLVKFDIEMGRFLHIPILTSANCFCFWSSADFWCQCFWFVNTDSSTLQCTLSF